MPSAIENHVFFTVNGHPWPIVSQLVRLGTTPGANPPQPKGKKDSSKYGHTHIKNNSHYYAILFRKLSAPTIYCIHGNTFGVARCCENLDGSKHHAVSSVGDHHESVEALNDSTSPIIDISDSRPILGRPLSQESFCAT